MRWSVRPLGLDSGQTEKVMTSTQLTSLGSTVVAVEDSLSRPIDNQPYILGVKEMGLGRPWHHAAIKSHG